MAEEVLDRADVGPSLEVANECRSVWQVTRRSIRARRAAWATAFWTADGLDVVRQGLDEHGRQLGYSVAVALP